MPDILTVEFLSLINSGESQTLEFKSSFDKACIESLVAFANAHGGSVLVGVSDAGHLLGVTLGQETLNEWIGQIKHSTTPSLIPEISSHDINGKTIVQIQVDEFPVKPVNTKGRYFKRVANSNHALALKEISDLYLQSLQVSWDAHPSPGYDFQALDSRKIDRFLAKVKETGRFDLGQQDDHQTILQKLGYISHDQPTWAAMLLFAREPLRHHIHIGRFKTPSHIIDDRQFTDTLFEVTEQAMKFIVSHLSVAFEFDGSVQRKERFSYPLPALREALVNAIVHRDYTDGSDIQIKIFDDRITIYSPGRLYGGLRLEDLYTNHYPSKLRNKLVAQAFYLTGNIEKYGSGFIRIRKALEDYPEARLKIRESGHGLMLSFQKVARQPESQPVTDQVTDQVTAEVLRLLTAIRGAMSRLEIQYALGLKHLPHLRDAYLAPAIKQGLLEMTIPEKPQSRLQKYRLTPAGKTLFKRIKAQK